MKTLKNSLGDNLDWFSKGNGSFLNDKWDGLSTYRYSVAIENSIHHNYFTEKITDCFLANTMPIYFGCPNITDFFDDRSLVQIDLNDFQKSVDQIRNAIDKNSYDGCSQYVNESKRLILTKYNFFASLSATLRQIKVGKTTTKKTIYPEQHFQKTGFRFLLTKIFPGN